MKQTSKSAPARVRGGMLVLLILVRASAAGNWGDHPLKHSLVDMPVSLAPGTVQTPKFPVVRHWYWIVVQVERPLPSRRMDCIMGLTSGPLERKDCSSGDPLLRADWIIRENRYVKASGSSADRIDQGIWSKKYMFRFLGGFMGEAGKKYVVEVTFTKDAGLLNAANPHLIVIKQGDI